MSDIKIKERHSTESDQVDDVFGQYPFMLYKYHFITKKNIISFCKMMTNINERLQLTEIQKEQIECMEMLLVNKLHIVTVSKLNCIRICRN